MTVYITNGFAGAHGDAQHIVILQAHGTGQSRHVAVVGYGNGHVAEFLGGPQVDILHLGVEQVLGHFQEQGSHHGAVVNVHTGGGNADGIHAGHMGGGGLHGVHNALVMVVGVRGGLGEPDHFLRVDALAVDDGGHLAVGAAGVEADAAAVQMAANGLGIVLLLRQRLTGNDFKGTLIDTGHKVGVKGAGTLSGIGCFQRLINGLVAADVHPEAALHPKQCLHQTVHIVTVGLGHVGRTVDERLTDGHLTVGTLHRQAQGLAARFQKGPVEQPQGRIVGVQRRNVARSDFNTIAIHSVKPPYHGKSPRLSENPPILPE